MSQYSSSGSGSSDCPDDVIVDRTPSPSCGPCASEGRSESGIDLLSGQLTNCSIGLDAGHLPEILSAGCGAEGCNEVQLPAVGRVACGEVIEVHISSDVFQFERQEDGSYQPVPAVPGMSLSVAWDGVTFSHNGRSWSFADLDAIDGSQGTLQQVVVACNSNVFAFHFQGGDDVRHTLGRYNISGCKAAICGGDDSHGSRCMLESAIGGLWAEGATLVGISDSSGCYYKEGQWYYQKDPSRVK